MAIRQQVLTHTTLTQAAASSRLKGEGYHREKPHHAIAVPGAARQVTGSRYYLESDGTRLLVDCGMFQEREFLDRNWEPSPIPRRTSTRSS